MGLLGASADDAHDDREALRGSACNPQVVVVTTGNDETLPLALLGTACCNREAVRHAVGNPVVVTVLTPVLVVMGGCSFMVCSSDALESSALSSSSYKDHDTRERQQKLIVTSN